MDQINLTNDEITLFNRLNVAISANSFDGLKQLIINSPSRKWCRMKTDRWNHETLLQKTIVQNKRDMFDFLLPFHDLVDLEVTNHKDETALIYAVRYSVVEYYGVKLLEYGAFMDDKCNLLNLCIKFRRMKIVEALLDRGCDVNGEYSGTNPLIEAVKERNSELITCLLSYGADPLIQTSIGRNAFNEAFQSRTENTSILELLCYCGLDRYSSGAVPFHFLLQIASKLPHVFQEIVHLDIKFVLQPFSWDYQSREIVRNLFKTDIKYFEIIASKCILTFRKLFVSVSKNSCYNLGFIRQKDFLAKLNLLIENPKLKDETIRFISSLNGNHVSACICQDQESATGELMMFMLQYGLKCYESFFHAVYNAHGYCDLFKFLLHMDVEEEIVCRCYTGRESIIVILICDINIDLEHFFKHPRRNIRCQDEIRLLDYFAHPKLANYLILHRQHQYTEAETLKILAHPQVPLLLEIARNVFRKYFVKTFKIEDTKQFYGLLRTFPISEAHKKIISLETTLYS